MSKQAQLDELKAQILEDDPTPELRSGATQLVFGVGDPDADIVFIGEAPGKNEDEQGEPFVGAAGKFLNEMLESIHLKRAQVYITNIVKYRPPNNRDPEPEEKKVFLPYLIRQIDIIKPKIIATLGRHSGGLFLPELKISQDHGQPKRITLKLAQENIKTVILPLYHPAAALYNGSQRQVLIDDFMKIPEIINLINKETERK